MQVVIIGGGAAGTSAALEIRKRLRDAQIIVFNEGTYSEYSPCALPFVIGRHIDSFDDIIMHPPSFYESIAKVDLRLSTRVTSIDPGAKQVHTSAGTEHYDKLVIATGSTPALPPVEGLADSSASPRMIVFKDLDDAKMVDALCASSSTALVIGAGLIGTEMAVALAERGLSVTIAEALPTILPHVLDEDMASRVISHLASQGITVRTSTCVERIDAGDQSVTALLAGEEESFDFCIVACGVCADATLASDAGLEVGAGIVVSETMQTSDPDIYACGDCCSPLCAITGNRTLSQLGSTAVRQAKVLADHIAGAPVQFPPVLNTAITRLAGLDIASVGLTEAMARDAGFEVSSSRFKGSTLPEYYPGGDEIAIKLVYTPTSHLVGGQVIGRSGVLTRIDALSVAMQNGMDLGQVAIMETAYTPPLSPTVDPLCTAAEMALRRLKKRK